MKIFISYRRDDSAGHAGRLFDHLKARFGSQHIFMDIDTIQPGEDFRQAIEKAVGTCDVVLVLIGKQWLSATDDKGRRRLDNPGDFVRAEIASALTNLQVRVIPVLVRDAVMPSAHELPEDLKELAWRNAIELSDNRFQYDANKLIGVIEQLGVKPTIIPVEKNGKWRTTKLIGAILALLGFVTVFLLIKFDIIPIPPSELLTPTNMPTSTFTDIPATTTSTIIVVTPTSTENPLSAAIQVTQQYFNHINNAGVKDDLSRAWDLMTNKLQCNPSDICNVDHYQEYWWQLQVQYKLYDCGSNRVTAELIYYSRGDTPNPLRSPAYVTYELLEENGELKLHSAKTETGVSAYCTLLVTSP